MLGISKEERTFQCFLQLFSVIWKCLYVILEIQQIKEHENQMCEKGWETSVTCFKEAALFCLTFLELVVLDV